MATTPRLFSPRTCAPATPTKARSTEQPAMSSASSTACLIEETQASRLTTTPLRIPREGAEPNPVMSMLPVSRGSAIRTQTLVWPMSSPTRWVLGRGISVSLHGDTRPERDAVPEPQIDVRAVAEVRGEVVAQRQIAVEIRSKIVRVEAQRRPPLVQRSEEHTSELQSPCNLVCRLLLEKK